MVCPRWRPMGTPQHGHVLAQGSTVLPQEGGWRALKSRLPARPGVENAASEAAERARPADGKCGSTCAGLEPVKLGPMRPPRFILALLAVDLMLGVLAGVGHLTALALGLEGIDFIRLGKEANLPSWYSASQLLLVALAFGLAASRRVVERGAWFALAPAAFFALLSIDEGAQVHERVGWWAERTLGVGADLITGPWLFIVVPAYGVLLWVTARAVWPLVQGRPRVIGLGLAGSALFVLAAAGMEGLGNFTAPDAWMARRVLGVFEEVGEMVAATVLLWSGWELARAEGVRIAFEPDRPGPTGPAEGRRSPDERGPEPARERDPSPPVAAAVSGYATVTP